jgi:hypothetical protein
VSGFVADSLPCKRFSVEDSVAILPRVKAEALTVYTKIAANLDLSNHSAVSVRLDLQKANVRVA